MSLLQWQETSVQTPDGTVLTPPLSFELSSGSRMIVRGPNGSGKTTLLKQIDVLSKQRGIPSAYVGQTHRQDRYHVHTLEEILELFQASHNHELLQGLDLRRQWRTASGGERQRTLLTCSMAASPKILLLDEPFNHLDHESSKRIESWLHSVSSAEIDCLVLVNHNDSDLFRTDPWKAIQL
jgi:ATPase subunit of ABC transporter with duplicated ATPase domains